MPGEYHIFDTIHACPETEHRNMNKKYFMDYFCSVYPSIEDSELQYHNMLFTHVLINMNRI